jgi:hypothetical protein
MESQKLTQFKIFMQHCFQQLRQRALSKILKIIKRKKAIIASKKVNRYTRCYEKVDALMQKNPGSICM